MQFDRHPEEEEGANTTGIFDDSTDTYTAAATDAMNYQIVTGSTGNATPHLLRYMVMQHLRLQLQTPVQCRPPPPPTISTSQNEK